MMLVEGGNLYKYTFGNYESISNTELPADSDSKIFFTNNEIGYIICRNVELSEIYRTMDGGLSWQLMHSTTEHQFENMFFINDSTGYLCTQNKILKTTDYGQTMVEQFIEEGISLHKLQFINESTGFCLSSNNYYFETIDGGENWEQKTVNEFYTLTDIHMFSTQKGYISWYHNSFTNSYGLLSLNVPLNSSKEEMLECKIHPNPAQDFLNIDLDKYKIQQVEIYDLMGRLQLHAKTSRNRLNITGLKSGMYVVSIQTEDNKICKKFIKR